jgi:sugar O-acyltransferase (sialic acid O-acetyltransferase NeuD family)
VSFYKSSIKATFMNNIVYLYGAGGHSRVILDILESNNVTVKAVFDDDPAHAKLKNVPVTSGIRLLGSENFTEFEHPFIISIGSNVRRAEVAWLLRAKYGVAIHQSAIISPKATIGTGTVVLHGSIIQASAVLGEHVLINTAASVDHDNIIGDFAHISPHATLCGHVEVGEGTHIGAGAIVIPSVKVGKWCTVGAGAVVLRDVADFSVVVGNPARVIKTFIPQEVMPLRT